jgi:hypothetical protein
MTPPDDRIPNWVDFGPARPARPARAPRVREAIGAGFTHAEEGKFPVPDAAGFEAGGPADRLAPCGELAALTGMALETGVDRLTDDELIGVMRAARRVASWQAAAELACVGELTARRRAGTGDTGPGPARQAGTTDSRPGQAGQPGRGHTSKPAQPGQADSGRRPSGGGLRPTERAAAEIAAALTLTGRAADLLVDLADQVSRLPSVTAALARGAIDLAKLRVFADELASLPGPVAELIASPLLLAAPGLTTGQLRPRLRRAVLGYDPDSARQRQERARAGALVETWPEASGNAALAGRELPEADVIAADRRLTAIAAWLRQRGVPGTVAQLRAAAYTCLLLGHPLTTLLPGGSDPVDSDSSLATSAGPPVTGSLNLTLPLATWMGLANRPGQVSGYGPANAGTCRDLAASLTGSPDTRYALTITTPGGHPLGHATTTTPPPGPPPRGTPSGTGPPGTGPPGTGPPGTGPPGTGPPAAGPPAAGPPGTGPPGTGPPAAGLDSAIADWIARLRIDWLTTGICDHRRQTPGYRPGRTLTRLIKVRNPTCTAPGCRRPATASDLDHLIPYQDGGRSCECNLHTPCRRHHRLKGTGGWHADMTTPGTITWTLPHGRTYTTTPEPYPV